MAKYDQKSNAHIATDIGRLSAGMVSLLAGQDVNISIQTATNAVENNFIFFAAPWASEAFMIFLATSTGIALIAACKGITLDAARKLGQYLREQYNKPKTTGNVKQPASAAAGGAMPPEGDPEDHKKNPKKGESEIWKKLKNYRNHTKTNGETGSKREYYEWDFTHNDIEVYNQDGIHKGSMDPRTGEMYKPAEISRKINL